MSNEPAGRRRIVAVSGSLRAKSSNGRLLALVAGLAPPGFEVVLFDGIGELPHFNPDIDRETDVPRKAVAAWRAAIRGAAGLVVSCPEYAHGVPGSFKNALDWLVSSADLLGKPVLLLNASSIGGEFAQPSLAETLTMLGANVLPESRLAPFVPPGFRAEDPDAATLAVLHEALAALAAAAG
jgi:chromate reductase, NAD(P)H dehydrogenase (quinone)